MSKNKDNNNNNNNNNNNTDNKNTQEEKLKELIDDLSDNPEELIKQIENLLIDNKDLSSKDINIGKNKVKIISNYNSKKSVFWKKLLNILTNSLILFVFFFCASILFKVFDNNDTILYLLFSFGYSLLTNIIIAFIKRKLFFIYSLFSIILDVIGSLIAFVLSYILIKQVLPQLIAVNLSIMILVYVISIAIDIFVNRYIKKRIGKKLYDKKTNIK